MEVTKNHYIAYQSGNNTHKAKFDVFDEEDALKLVNAKKLNLPSIMLNGTVWVFHGNVFRIYLSHDFNGKTVSEIRKNITSGLKRIFKSTIDTDELDKHGTDVTKEFFQKNAIPVLNEFANEEESKSIKAEKEKQARKTYRLGRIAGELNVGVSTIIDFLASVGIKQDVNPNSKLDINAYEMLVEHFGERSKDIEILNYYWAIIQMIKTESLTLDVGDTGSIDIGNLILQVSFTPQLEDTIIIWQKSSNNSRFIKCNVISLTNSGTTIIFGVDEIFETNITIDKFFTRIKGNGINIPYRSKGESLYQLTKEKFNLLIENLEFFVNNKTQKSTTRYAELLADSTFGEDYLDIEKDVTAFAKLITAKTFTPPLAIALFGKWGTGKSFFMNKMKIQIQAFSSMGEDSPYCQGIAHIHFNAWSYLDANLWASLVARIFEGLREYMTDVLSSELVIQDIEKELLLQFTITKDELDNLESQKQTFINEIDNLLSQKNVLNDQLNEDISSIENKTLDTIITRIDSEFEIRKRVDAALADNPTSQSTIEILKVSIPEQFWDNPTLLYHQAKSRIIFLKEFFRKDKLKNNLIWLGSILIIIALVPLIVNLWISKLKHLNLLFPQVIISALAIIGFVWKRVEKTYNTLQPLIASFWNIKDNYEQQIKQAISKYEQEEKALKLRIDKTNQEVEAINDKIYQATELKSKIEFKINNAVVSEVLSSFIEKRSKSEDYQKHLGIISTIRKDFEILNNLFLKQHEEHTKEAEFIEHFGNKRLERIVLYIDDLDRCSEDRVVEVMEAVNLLMAFPLFVVVVGVDPRWVKSALIKRYHLQFTGQLHGNDMSQHSEVIEAANYLEKIFQIPFHLKEATDLGVKHMLKTLITPKAFNNNDFIDEEENERNYNITENTATQNELRMGEAQMGEAQMGQIEIQETIEDVVDYPESLVLTEIEVQLIQNLSLIIGNNPRAIKRFVNVYHIVRTHEGLSYEKEYQEKDYLVIMFLLALPIGPYKKLNPLFKSYIANEENRSNKFQDFLSYNEKVSDQDQFHEIKNKLHELLGSLNMVLHINIADFKEHCSFIQRFTFED